MFQTYLTNLAVALRGVTPRQNLAFQGAGRIALGHGGTAMTLAQAGGFLCLAWVFTHSTTLFGHALALGFLGVSLPFLVQIALSLLCPVATIAPGGVVIARMPFVALRPVRLPADDFRLGLRPYRWSRTSGRRRHRRTEVAHGWAFTLEHPRMLPVVLEMRWQGPNAGDLPDDDAAGLRAAELARTLGLRGVITGA
jgi:hypothetical protein